jgi:predicted nucleotidyltransferase
LTPSENSTPSLLPLLRSATQAGILERLFLHPDQAYTVGELAELLGVTDLSVRRELYRMVDAGMVDREAVGRQSVFRASVASPLYEPMRQLVERSVGVEPLLRELIEQTPGVELAAIYGSWARGAIDAESDVDLLVVGDIDYAALVAQLMALQERAGREINAVWMRPQEWREREGSAFVQEILSSPVRVLAGSLSGR